MNPSPRLLTAALLAAGLLFGALPAQADAPVTPGVANALKAAAELMRAGRYPQALAKVHDAEAFRKTEADATAIDRARMYAAAGAGDNGQAEQSFQHLQGKMSASEEATMAQSLAQAEFNAGHMAKATEYAKLGGNTPAMQQILTQAELKGGNGAAIIRQMQSRVDAETHAGHRPAESDLTTLAGAYQTSHNEQSLTAVLGQLVAYYPTKAYWNSYLIRLPQIAGFDDRLSLDVYRVRLASNGVTKPEDYMEAAERALQAGFPAEGKAMLDKGYAAKVLGTGADASRQKRLMDLAVKQTADTTASLAKDVATAQAEKDGNNLVKLGYREVTIGQGPQGIVLMEQGIARDSLAHPDQEQLHLGIAQLQAGQKAQGLQTLKSVHGTDGSAEIARLWITLTNNPALAS